MKLMDIDADTLGIPDTEYDARVTMTASEFGRIVRDLSTLGESVRIEVSKEGVRFASDGESANGSVLLKQTDAARVKYKDYGKDDSGPSVTQGGGDDDDDDEEGDSKKKVKKEDDVEMNGDDDDEEEGDGEFKAKSDDEGEDEQDEEEEKSSKKRKAPAKVYMALFLISQY